MAIGRTLAAVALVASSCAPAACRAAAVDSTAVLYALATPPSALEVGCQAPCACAIASLPTYGSFELIPAGSDPLYAYYDVLRFIASFSNGPGAVAIVGTGRYKIGGEVALVQQMTLDLQVEGQPVQHFDSGLVPVGAGFPAISVSCAVHGFYCFDSVLVVQARPAATGVPEPPPGGIALERVQPNPSRGAARILFRLGHAGAVDVAVFDVTGRRVRTLARGLVLPAGESALEWDGTREDGRPARAGIYWARLTTADGVAQRRFTRLE